MESPKIPGAHYVCCWHCGELMPAATALMMKSVAQLSLKPINYDGVHALPINECVKDAAHETDLSIRFKQEVETDQYAFVQCHPAERQPKLGIFYTQRHGMSLV
ncbi:hypothetical protein ACL655_22400 [Klebsiella quasipneumoniae subsp. similipneumoniae]